MTPEENTVMFQRLWDELFNQRKSGGSGRAVWPDFVNHMNSYNSRDGAAAVSARPAHMKQLVTTLTTAFSDSRFPVEDVIAAGDKVVGRSHGVAPARVNFWGFRQPARHLR